MKKKLKKKSPSRTESAHDFALFITMKHRQDLSSIGQELAYYLEVSAFLCSCLAFHQNNEKNGVSLTKGLFRDAEKMCLEEIKRLYEYRKEVEPKILKAFENLSKGK